jgi:hypothetical protein
MDSRGIEPRTTPMLRGYYTTKPQAHLLENTPFLWYIKPTYISDILNVCMKP